MDANSESPQTTIKGDPNKLEEGKDDSGDEEGMLDWSKIAPKSSKGQRALPKRGEKAFEPIAVGPSAYQKFTLERARQAMSEALSIPREIQTKRLSQAVWMPQYSQARVVDARGIMFGTLGFTLRRQGENQKRLELLPEEVLYLVERGSMLCWRESTTVPPPVENDAGDSVKLIGEPMSAQQCFNEMLGVDHITLEHYQVYSYFKRFGYTVRRAQPPTGYVDYTVYRHALPTVSFMGSIKNSLLRLWRSLGCLFRVDWWTRFHPGLVSYFRGKVDYPLLFESLRVIPSYTPPRSFSLEQRSSYNIFFHVWKPESLWNRVDPPRPDFEIVVINARTTPVPSIDELTALFNTLPVTRLQPKPQLRSLKLQATSSNILTRYLDWIHSLFVPVGKVNAFAQLKTGKRSVIFAVVDAGTTSMYRFNEGCFDEWPMI